jgi:hypothetical protein
VFVPDGGDYDPGEASHAVLLEPRRTIERHPAVLRARGDPPAEFTRVQADLDPRVLGATTEVGTLTIRWYSGATPDDPPEFAFHYRDGSGFDCGWHNEPNPRVEGWAHYRERGTPDEDYTYERISFASDHPVGILWAVLERLQDRLGT